MDSERSEKAAGHKVKQVTMSVEHPFLLRLDPESIRIFLRKYDAYRLEVQARASQLPQDSTVSLQPVCPVSLIYCVDAEQLESAVECGMIEGCNDVEKLRNDELRTFLEAESQESQTAVTESELAQLVEMGLEMDMTVKSATGRMKLLFMEYRSILRKNGLKWVIEKTPKLAVRHVLSAIKPAQLHTRLKQDIEFSHHHLKSNFEGFMRHAIDLSQAFEKIDIGPPKMRTTEKRNEILKTKAVQTGTSSSQAGVKHEPNEPGAKRAKKPPPSPCPLPKCKGKNKFHWISDCQFSTEAEKNQYKREVAAAKARDGPAHSTRSKTGRPSNVSKTIGRLKCRDQTSICFDAPQCKMTVSDDNVSLDITGRCDDGSDESIVSPGIAEKATLMGIGKIVAIETVRLEVALKKEEESSQYTFSRTWTVPCTVLQLSPGQLALKNIRFLVSDDDVNSEDLLIGFPVLRHLRIDTKTLLEERFEALNGIDCSLEVLGRPKIGNLGRLMRAHPNCRSNDEKRSQHANPTRPKVDYYQARREEDPFPDPSLLDPIDEDQHEEIKSCMEAIEQSAKENGLVGGNFEELQTILKNHLDIFRCSFSSGLAADIPPLKIELTSDAKPVKVRLRNYSQDQKEFMSQLVNNLTSHGLIYANPTSKWACAPLLVPKRGARYRFTVDLRPINKYTIRHHYPMPNLENEMTKLGTAEFFATFDLSSGYWQLPLSEESQECQSFITPDGIYTPTRVLHGTTNAVTHLQSALASIIPDDLKANMLCWLDDILLFAPTIEGLLRSVRSFFELCAARNLKLHPAKCILFATEIRWCGRILSSNGLRYDPRRLQCLLSMNPPTTGANLQQFICALQWMKQGIPNFTELVAPLHDFMERVYSLATNRTKRAVSRILLSDQGWGEMERAAFENCKNSLAHQVTLSHRDHSQRLSVYTDASDTAWSGIVTQVPTTDVSKPHKDQRHSPLTFLSGRFNRTQLGWSTLEKEAFAVLSTLDRMHWLVTDPNGFDLYTDHNNLIFLFDPLSVLPDMSQTSLRKVLRWAVRLSIYRYTCYHIKGDENVWADLLTRWSAARPIVRRLIHIPELPSACSDDFEWPTPAIITEAQKQHNSTRPDGLIINEGLWRRSDGPIWIPDNDSDLQLRLCIIAHTGPAGHRGRESTEKALRSVFTWSTLTEDVRAFVRSCIHCLSTTGGEKTPRPFGPAVHGTGPNDLLQFDYIDLGPSNSGDRYCLMLRDDHSDYKLFYCFPTTGAENAATAIIEWCSMFGVPNTFMSDGPTHFKNETLRLVSKGLKVKHHFTLAYCPWSNGAVERLGRELIRVLRALLSELQMNHKEWPDLIPMVQSVLNNSPSPQRGNMPPITAFMGREPSPPIRTFLRSAKAKVVTLTEAKAESALNIQKLIKLRDELHPFVQSSLDKNRRQAREAASRGQLPNFMEGDYVLVARSDFHGGEKLCLRWRGPRRIIKALNDYVYQVEDLRNGHLEDAHASRLKLFRDSSMNKIAIMSHVLQSETGMVVSRLLRLEKRPNGLCVLVRWKGLDSDEDSFEPIAHIHEDVPELFKKLLSRKSTPTDLAVMARAELAL